MIVTASTRMVTDKADGTTLRASDGRRLTTNALTANVWRTEGIRVRGLPVPLYFSALQDKFLLLWHGVTVVHQLAKMLLQVGNLNNSQWY